MMAIVAEAVSRRIACLHGHSLHAVCAASTKFRFNLVKTSASLEPLQEDHPRLHRITEILITMEHTAARSRAHAVENCKTPFDMIRDNSSPVVFNQPRDFQLRGKLLKVFGAFMLRVSPLLKSGICSI